MLKALFENPKALVMAILVHVVLLGVLLVSIDWTSKPPPATQVETVKAVVVDESRVQAEMEKLKKAEQKKKDDEAARQQKLRREAEVAKKKRQAEEKRLKDLEQKKSALAKKAREEELRLAEAKKQREQEAKRQAEEKKKQAEEARRKQELAEKARRAKELQEQMLAEQQAARQTEINRYIALIRNKVSQNWLQLGFQKGLKCTVQVNLIPSGDVVNARVTVSSGNAQFDDSVLKAVHKASPLPLPKDPVLLNEMRVINFEFEPKA
jgi:colicin import membrane protein